MFPLGSNAFTLTSSASLLENFQGQVHMSQLQRRLLRFKDLLGPRKPLQRHQMRLAGKVCRGLADPHGDMAYTAPVLFTLDSVLYQHVLQRL